MKEGRKMAAELQKNSRYCRETRVIQTHRVFPFHANAHGTLFGGELMKQLDDCASITAQRFSRAAIVTASVDSLNFLKPLMVDDSVCIETFVSGAGKSSMEIFAKVLGENLKTGERYLAATCFMTFVALRNNDGIAVHLPNILPETPEEQFICQDYESRKANRMAIRQSQAEFDKHITIEMPW